MAICNLNPSEQNKFDITSSVLGEKIAFKDYINQNGLLRPPSAIVNDMKRDLFVFEDDVVVPGGVSALPSAFEDKTINELRNTVQSLIRKNNQENSIAVIQKFADRLNVGYKVITSAEAFQFTNRNDIKGFYKAGIVYLVEGKFTSDTVFHEFAHPIVKALAKENPEIFNELYSQIPAEFISSVEQKSNDLYDITSPEFKEEVMVQSLTEINANEPMSWLGKILFQIKQFLRGKFGKKINLKELSGKTTLKDFVDMINYGKEFELDMNYLTEDDFIYFEQDFNQLEAILNNEVGIKQEVQTLVNAFAKMTADQIQAVSSMKGYSLLAPGLVSETSNEEILQLMNRTLNLLKGNQKAEGKDFVWTGGLIGLSSMELASKINMFAEQIVRIDKLVDVLDKKIKQLERSDLSDLNNLNALHAATELLSQYAKFLENGLKTGSSYIQLANNPLREKMNSILNRLRNRDTGVLYRANNLKVDIVVDLIYDHLIEVGDTGRKVYENQLQMLKDSNSMKEYNNLHKEYYGLYPDELQELEQLRDLRDRDLLPRIQGQRLKELEQMRYQSENLTKEEFKEYIASDFETGYGGKWLNRMFESYSMNQDKATGGFYSFITQHLNEVKANANARQAALLGNNKLYDLLDKAGWGTSRHIASFKLGKAMSATVNVGQFDPKTGEIQDFNEYQFISNFKDFQPVIQQLRQNVRDAQTEYEENDSVSNRTALAEATERYFIHNMLFMNNDFNDTYYLIEYELYKDDIGRAARWAREDILNEINDLGDTFSAIADYQVAEERAKLYNQLAQLANEYSIDGKLKTGIDLEIAKRLKDYNLRRNTEGIFTWEQRSNLFQEAYTEAMLRFEEEAAGNTDVFDELRERWINANTTSRVGSAYYDYRTALLNEREQLLAPLTEENKKIFDLTALYEELYEQNRATRDSGGEYDGMVASADKQKRIVELHAEIEELNQSLYNISGNGLSKEEVTLYWELYNIEKEGGVLSSQEQVIYADLKQKWIDGFGDLFVDEYGVNNAKAVVDRVKEINNLLRVITTTNYTTHYIDQWRQLFEENDDLQNDILLTLNDIYGNMDEDDMLKPEHNLTEKDIRALLKSDNLAKLNSLRSNPVFNDWFENNHYEVTKAEKQTSGEWETRLLFTPTSLWYKTTPSDIDFYESFELTDDSGNTIGVLLDKNGLPRVPNANYQVRQVNSSFLNKKTDRDIVTKDSTRKEILEIANRTVQETWLPKTLDQRRTIAAKMMFNEFGIADPTDEEIEDYLESNFNIEQGSWTRYINNDYQDMFDNNRDFFNLVNFVKNWHLDNQMDLNPSQRIGITFPKDRKNNGEDVMSKGFHKRRLERTKDMFNIRVDDAESELNRLRSTNDERLDSLDRPISGTYGSIDINEVSTDILETTQRHMYSINEYIAFRELNTIAKSFQFALTEWDMPSDKYTVTQKVKVLNTFSTNKQALDRVKSINSIIEGHFQNVALAGNEAESIGKQRAQKLLGTTLTRFMRWSSRKWFMFNPMSGITNFASANLQSMYKFVYADTFISPVDFIAGHARANKTLAMYAKRTYSAKGKTAQMQLMDILDASPDKYMRQIGESGSRTLLKDLYEGKVGYASRAYMTHEVNYMAMYALMNNRKNKFKLNGKMVRLDQAVELDAQGRMVTKAGVPTEWAITYDADNKVQMGDKVKKMMNLHKGYLSKIHGMAGKYQEGDYDRYLLGKVVGFIFKFLPGMVTDRYGARVKLDTNQKQLSRTFQTKRRFNYNTEQYELGTTIEALKFAQTILEAPISLVRGKGIKKKAFMREQYKGMVTLLMTYFVGWILNFLRHAVTFNPDSERMKKWLGMSRMDEFTPLKTVTSLPDLPWVNPARTYTDVNWRNYMNLQYSRLLLRVSRENNTFYPSSLGGILWGQVTEPAALSGTVTDAANIVTSIMELTTQVDIGELADEEGGIVFLRAQDKTRVGQTAGPYTWQQKGASKLIKNMVGYFGFNGNMIDPFTAMKNERNFYKEPWNPFDIIIGDPTYQPYKPYQIKNWGEPKQE
jgi:hypothetical protein